MSRRRGPIVDDELRTTRGTTHRDESRGSPLHWDDEVEAVMLAFATIRNFVERHQRPDLEPRIHAVEKEVAKIAGGEG